MTLGEAVKTLVLARAWMGLCHWQYDAGKISSANYAEHKSYSLFCSIPDDLLHIAQDAIK